MQWDSWLAFTIITDLLIEHGNSPIRRRRPPITSGKSLIEVEKLPIETEIPLLYIKFFGSIPLCFVEF
ncbi:hypothetical protein F3157_17695 [Virgibacillus dakarensis]|nr:hypothetical protein [Virgibacillus dakarensis]